MGILLFFVILSLFQIAESDYTLPQSKNYLMHAYAAYCTADSLRSWDCFWCANTTEKFFVTHVFYEEFTNTYGYIGYNSQEIMVVFRGTREDSLKNWITDLNSMVLIWYPSAGPYAAIAGGFYLAYTGVREETRDAIRALRTQFPSLPLVLVGHSLGGALSSVCAIDLYEELNETAITHWTYGSPRIGNADFVSYFEQVIPTTFVDVSFP